MVVKTFRGQLAHGGQDRIRLHTTQGKVGYQIKKFQVMPPVMGGASSESCVRIFKTNQTAVTATVDFTDLSLLAAAQISNHTSGYIYPPDATIIFDNQVVNQDIYITNQDNAGSEACNYYLELEVIPLSDLGAEYTTLKDIRTQLQIS